MAIQPIDLQTLFTQLDKVGKSQMSQKEGLAIQQSLLGIQMQKKTEEQVHSVDETKQAGEGAEGINDRNARKKSGEQSADRGEAGDKDEQDISKNKAVSVFRDPTLGRNIDMSG
jgi:hypothetical protein